MHSRQYECVAYQAPIVADLPNRSGTIFRNLSCANCVNASLMNMCMQIRLPWSGGPVRRWISLFDFVGKKQHFLGKGGPKMWFNPLPRWVYSSGNKLHILYKRKYPHSYEICDPVSTHNFVDFKFTRCCRYCPEYVWKKLHTYWSILHQHNTLASRYWAC